MACALVQRDRLAGLCRPFLYPCRPCCWCSLPSRHCPMMTGLRAHQLKAHRCPPSAAPPWSNTPPRACSRWSTMSPPTRAGSTGAMPRRCWRPSERPHGRAPGPGPGRAAHLVHHPEHAVAAAPHRPEAGRRPVPQPQRALGVPCAGRVGLQGHADPGLRADGEAAGTGAWRSGFQSLADRMVDDFVRVADSRQKRTPCHEGRGAARLAAAIRAHRTGTAGRAAAWPMRWLRPGGPTIRKWWPTPSSACAWSCRQRPARGRPHRAAAAPAGRSEGRAAAARGWKRRLAKNNQPCSGQNHRDAFRTDDSGAKLRFSVSGQPAAQRLRFLSLSLARLRPNCLADDLASSSSCSGK